MWCIDFYYALCVCIGRDSDFCHSLPLSLFQRVMPSGFFCLLRFYLRVDSTLVRVHDARLYHRAGRGYLIREATEREATAAELEEDGVSASFHSL